ncbi:hypothetical protein [Yinghuangia seranimata]|uniref:hypothetical protein n=1 Tax=Yinghuangia seranimata TaxID=408067 RepID=UPI00248AA08D|nr:hypothetical protein [Yinghuangia seranimata]MDI2130752.1 hypothetical protein [Yinghuangia seranimata]
MNKFLLTLHVLAAVLAVGPVAVAASMFPAAVRRAVADGGGPGSVASVRTLHRVCRVYAVLGIGVPVFGFATASSMGVLGSAWLVASIAITTVAAGVLAVFVLPRQDALLSDVAALPGGAAAPDPRRLVRLAMLTGAFNVLWATVTVLMIVRPGSTTGA